MSKEDWEKLIEMLESHANNLYWNYESPDYAAIEEVNNVIKKIREKINAEDNHALYDGGN